MKIVDLIKARRDASLLLDMPDMAASLFWDEASGIWCVYFEQGPLHHLRKGMGEEEAVQTLLGFIASQRERIGSEQATGE